MAVERMGVVMVSARTNALNYGFILGFLFLGIIIGNKV